MRDLVRYPIKLDEVLACLDKLATEIVEQNIADQRVGDMRPLLLQKAHQIVLRAGFAVSDVAP